MLTILELKIIDDDNNNNKRQKIHKNIFLTEISQREKENTVCFHLYDVIRIGKLIHTKNC